MPHVGDLREAGVIEAAYDFNVPLRVRELKPGRRGPTEASWVRFDRRGVVVEALKMSESGDAIVLRFYEAEGRRGPVQLQLGFPVTDCLRVDLLEREIEALDLVSGQVSLQLRPFEIATLKFPIKP